LPADLELHLDGAGLQRTVLVNALHSVGETAWVLALADATPRFAGVGAG
jgi:hypothetical protein